ncbi:MAG: hypothetical protein GY809_00270 [Planctomycetes bacterium]|nr:hypothetical protein [Planctomycetota bacterium]
MLRVMPTHDTIQVPHPHKAVAQQYIACHMGHCQGRLGPSSFAVHTTTELNSDATWSILPVGDQADCTFVIVKVDLRGELGGSQWTSAVPYMLTVEPPSVLDHELLTAGTTLPLVIAPCFIAKHGVDNIPRHFLWRFPHPLGEGKSLELGRLLPTPPHLTGPKQPPTVADASSSTDTTHTGNAPLPEAHDGELRD